MRSAATWGLVALALLAFPVPAAFAEPELVSQQTETYPAQMLAPDREAAEFFAAVSERARTEGVLQSLPENILGNLEQPLGQIVEEMFRRGDRSEDWDRGSPGLLALLAPHDGTAVPTMLVGQGNTGPFATFLASEGHDELVPSDWVKIASFGEVDASTPTILAEMGYLSPKLVLMSELGFARRGTALCSGRGRHSVFMRPDVPAAEADLIAFFTAAYIAERNLPMCISAVGGPDTYTLRYYDPEGHRLPGLETPSVTYRRIPFTRFDRLGDFRLP